MVPLVFKTSLGAVRSPEGSTPSLLRQQSVDKLANCDCHVRAVRKPFKKRSEARRAVFVVRIRKTSPRDEDHFREAIERNKSYESFSTVYYSGSPLSRYIA